MGGSGRGEEEEEEAAARRVREINGCNACF